MKIKSVFLPAGLVPGMPGARTYAANILAIVKVLIENVK
jgi:hypothetical protein